MSYVLVVDDDPDVRSVLAMLLGVHGYDVVEAEGGAEALAHLDGRGIPSLILLDLRMPGMSGEELIEALRARMAAAHRRPPPIVVLSGDVGLGGRAGALGVEAMLQKPVDLTELLDTVARLADGGRPALRPA